MSPEAPTKRHKYFLHREIRFDRFLIVVSIVENKRTRPPMVFWSPCRPIKIPIEAQRRIEAAVAELRTAPRTAKPKLEATT